jgi:hypothetical protein
MASTIETGTGKKGDYWYIDFRSKGARVLCLALAATLAMLGASCSAGTSQMMEPQEGAGRNTSGLLGSLTGAVTTTLSGTTGIVTDVVGTLGKWFIDEDVVPADPAKCPFTVACDGRTLNIASGVRFDKVEVYYSDGSKDNTSVYTTSLAYRLRYGKTLAGFMVRLKADGSKWFFDNGKWFIDADSARWYGDCDSTRWYGDVDNAQTNQDQNN